MLANLLMVYLAVAGIGTVIFALLFFAGLWALAAIKYRLPGLVLGWIPGAVAALVGGPIAGLFWPVTAWVSVVGVRAWVRDVEYREWLRRERSL